ncbi:DUF6479 family protein [Streptomyces fructofermentans]|uniref:DUF6479 family protein n=1 Tax=Streptomyces fructofermentans TaxID=152141 RepID=UPI0037AE79BB
MTTPVFLAASGSSSLFLMVAGPVLVLLLIGAFWYGSRRAAHRRAPRARPTDQNPQAASRSDSWQTPEDGAGGQLGR